MHDTLEQELNVLNSAHLYSLVPSFLYDSFKDELNDRILVNLIYGLDHIIQSVDANNSLMILSLDDDDESSNSRSSSENNSTKSNKRKMTDLSYSFLAETVFSSQSQFQSFLIDISTRLVQLFTTYSREVNNYLELFERQERLIAQQTCASSVGVATAAAAANKGFKIMSRQELLIYQRATVVQKLKSRHYNLLNLLFRSVFDFYQKRSDSAAAADDEDNETDENAETLIQRFHTINKIVFELELFDHLCGDTLVQVVENKIREHIESISLDNYEESFIKPFEAWLDNIVIGWIKLIYSSSRQQQQQQQQDEQATTTTTPPHSSTRFEQYLNNYQKQLAHFMYSHYAHVRIKRLFDIVIDFPDSRAAIDDLKYCLTKTNLRVQVVNGLRTAIEQRLLHPGVNTADIITAYVSAIKALLCLDSSGIMMENVCEPLKRYLRSRDDTIKCIIGTLTNDPSAAGGGGGGGNAGGESHNDMMEEFCKDLSTNEGGPDEPGCGGGGGIDSAVAVLITSADNDMDGGGAMTSAAASKSWQTWIPEPIDVLCKNGSDRSGNGGLAYRSNIISMLVGIYGSKDLFVNEYKTLLGERLLANYTFNMEKEIRNLELLKLRFGDGDLFACEAMLKDIGESKRINTNILEQLRVKGVTRVDTFDVSAATLKCMVLSEQFWPKLKEEKIEMPAQLRQIQHEFTSSYEAFKGNRTLIWKNNLGLVTMDIEINKQVVEVSVTPIQAAVIIKFQERDTWSLLELSQSLKMCSFALRKKLAFWQTQGLIKLVPSAAANSTTHAANISSANTVEPAAAASAATDTNNEVYTLVKDNQKVSKLAKTGGVLNADEEDEANANQGRGAHNALLNEEELILYSNYLQNMLKGCGCLPIDRIHGWLKMYANADLSLEKVKYLIDVKIKEQLIKYNGGLYRLNK